MSYDPEEEIKKISKLPENRRCANCDAENRFGHGNVCMPFRTFVCSNCKSAHQAYSHRVKSILQSTWSKDEVESLRTKNGGGNDHCRRTWLALCALDDPNRPKDGDHPDKYKAFVIAAYENRRWFSLDSSTGLGPSRPQVASTSTSASIPTNSNDRGTSTPNVSASSASSNNSNFNVNSVKGRWGPTGSSSNNNNNSSTTTTTTSATIGSTTPKVAAPAPAPEPEIDLLGIGSGSSSITTAAATTFTAPKTVGNTGGLDDLLNFSSALPTTTVSSMVPTNTVPTVTGFNFFNSTPTATVPMNTASTNMFSTATPSNTTTSILGSPLSSTTSTLQIPPPIGIPPNNNLNTTGMMGLGRQISYGNTPLPNGNGFSSPIPSIPSNSSLGNMTPNGTMMNMNTGNSISNAFNFNPNGGGNSSLSTGFPSFNNNTGIPLSNPAVSSMGMNASSAAISNLFGGGFSSQQQQNNTSMNMLTNSMNSMHIRPPMNNANNMNTPMSPLSNPMGMPTTPFSTPYGVPTPNMNGVGGGGGVPPMGTSMNPSMMMRMGPNSTNGNNLPTAAVTGFNFGTNMGTVNNSIPNTSGGGGTTNKGFDPFFGM